MRIKKVTQTTPIQAEVVDSLDGNSTTNAPSQRAVNEEFIKVKGKILWTNPNPTSSFASQTITLSSDDYDMYDIFYVSESSGTLNNQLKTVRVIKGYDTILEITNPLGSTTPIRSRKLTYVSDISLTFSDGYTNNVYPLTTDNTKCIPLYIVGYKTGLFS